GRHRALELGPPPRLGILEAPPASAMGRRPRRPPRRGTALGGVRGRPGGSHRLPVGGVADGARRPPAAGRPPRRPPPRRDLLLQLQQPEVQPRCPPAPALGAHRILCLARFDARPSGVLARLGARGGAGVLGLWRPGARRPPPPSPLVRPFLLTVTLGPCLVYLAVSALTGFRLLSGWGTPLWSYLGVGLLVWRRPAADPAVSRRFRTWL